MKSPAYQWFPKDILSDWKYQSLSYEHRGMYRDLLDYMWLAGNNSCQLPFCEKKIAAVLKVSEKKSKTFLEKIITELEMLPVIDGHIVSKRQLQEKERQEDRRKKCSEAGKKSGNVRSTNVQHKGNSGVQQKPNSASASPSATAFVKEKIYKKEKKITRKEIEEIYNLYPSTDKNNNQRSTAKGAKCKEKIKSILKTDYPLKDCIKLFVALRQEKCEWLPNFMTFLNNLPDKQELIIELRKMDYQKEIDEIYLPKEDEDEPYDRKKEEINPMVKDLAGKMTG